MEMNVWKTTAKKAEGQVKVSEKIFDAPYNESLVHQVVTCYLTNARSGSKAQKTRGEVSFSKIKPWRQKGTGRARAGKRSSPIWTKGGVTFAAKPKEYNQKVNRKMYQKAIGNILSELNRQERLLLLEKLELKELKTKEFVKILQGFKADDVMIVTKEIDEKLYFASRNVPSVTVCHFEFVFDLQGCQSQSLV